MTPCGRVLGTRTRANRNGSGTRNGAAASANRRDDDVEPGEPLKPSLATPWPELPKGIVGRTSATVCFLAAFDSGGGRASTLLTVSRAATRSIAARTSGLGEEVKVARRTANARASTQRCESGTRAVGRAHVFWTSCLPIARALRIDRTVVTAGSSVSSKEIPARGRKVTISAVASLAASALAASDGSAASAGSTWTRMTVVAGGADCAAAAG